MKTLLVATVVGVVFAGAVLYTALGFRWTFALRRKGYRSPLAVATVALYLMVAWFGSLMLFVLSDAYVGSNAQTEQPAMIPAAFANVLTLLLVPLGASAAAGEGGMRMLPRRLARRKGGRRQSSVPWRALGWALLGLLLSSPVLDPRGLEHGVVLALRLSLLLVPASAACFHLARRAKAVSLDELIANDSRPPVLYVRSFGREERVFAELPREQLPHYASHGQDRLGATLEEYFARAFAEEIGPLLALGSPEDYLPPEGAARAYFEEDNWKSEFAALAARAACLVMAPDGSENVHAELTWVRRANLQVKLFILTPTAPRSGFRFRWLRRYNDWYERNAEIAPQPWPEFAASMQRLGYQVSAEPPPPATVVTFDADGRELRWSAGSGTPEEFVAVIASRLAAPVTAASEEGVGVLD